MMMMIVIIIIIITNRFDFNLHLRTFENHILSSDLHKECQGWFEYYTTRHQQDCAECLTKYYVQNLLSNKCFC